jgi:hypothetical protein
MGERSLPHRTPQQKKDYQELVDWLESHGESVEQAKSDLERWSSWTTFNGEYRRNMDAEIAAHKSRKAREKKGAAAEGAASP